MTWLVTMFKNLIWVIIICSVIGYFAYNYIEQRAEDKAERQEAERIEGERRNKLARMVSNTHAVDDWVQVLGRGEKLRFKIMTYELEQCWLSDRPILFMGSIDDIASTGKGYYEVIVKREFINSLDTIFFTQLSLRLKCEKDLIDEMLRTHPELLSGFGFNNSVAVVAKIHKIVSGFINSEDGKREEIKSGIGDCVDIMYMGNVKF